MEPRNVCLEISGNTIWFRSAWQANMYGSPRVTARLLAETWSFSQVSDAGRWRWNERQKAGVSPSEIRI